MTTHYTLTPITIDGRSFIRERYVPRTKPEAERNRSQEEARRRRQAQRAQARRGKHLARFRVALDSIVTTGEKAAEAMHALANLERAWPPAPDPLRALDMLPPGGTSS